MLPLWELLARSSVTLTKLPLLSELRGSIWLLKREDYVALYSPAV